MEERYDLVVIGVGPAGEKGATQVAYFGKRVAVLERSEVPGGTPATTGAIPTKRAPRGSMRPDMGSAHWRSPRCR
jgi:NAD(P) transhydrogenase